ncbi:hypothetical protein JG688_00009089 [Phytophthora aleatoria]|uniref:Complex 1 LYR protein domain-containing protein n=1 Tax=Phytophthora aleatoria TaxID=2496075 RepID=A0A8J5MG13_9STRA|nr:hypothetical protein JG688_00009089 [Phytophthora aleatoria]
MAKTRAEALRLYRAIYRQRMEMLKITMIYHSACFTQLQAAGEMPTRDRINYVRRRLRHEYDQAREETNPERISFLLRLAETQLDTVEVQAQHLNSDQKLKELLKSGTKADDALKLL